MQFYHEVKTRKRFRSLKEAKKYVKMEANETEETLEASQPGGHSKASQQMNYLPRLDIKQ